MRNLTERERERERVRDLHGLQSVKEKREFIFILTWLCGSNPSRTSPHSVELITHILAFWGFGLWVPIATTRHRL